jgi:ribosome recycling factor
MKCQTLILACLLSLAFAGEYTDEVKADVKAALMECYEGYDADVNEEPTDEEVEQAEATLEACIDTVYDQYGEEAKSYLKACVKEAASGYEVPEDEEEPTEEETEAAQAEAEKVIDQCIDEYYASTKTSLLQKQAFRVFAN